jgi:hypothetical protein
LKFDGFLKVYREDKDDEKWTRMKHGRECCLLVLDKKLPLKS